MNILGFWIFDPKSNPRRLICCGKIEVAYNELHREETLSRLKMPKIDFEKIRSKVRVGDYEISVHIMRQLRKRQLRMADIENAIIYGQIIERDPNAKPNPKCIFLGEDALKGESLHVVCSLTPDALLVTVYFPDEDFWSKDRYRRRKRKRR